MIALQVAGYVVLLALLTVTGNDVCKWVLQLSATKTPAEAGEKISLRVGRTIGVLERTLIAIGLIAGAWEILAAVVALKTVARYSKLDEQNNAEYFLVGSLASILWAVFMTGVLVAYDATWGAGALPPLLSVLGR